MIVQKTPINNRCRFPPFFAQNRGAMVQQQGTVLGTPASSPAVLQSYSEYRKRNGSKLKNTKALIKFEFSFLDFFNLFSRCWLHVKFWIQYQVYMFLYTCFHGTVADLDQIQQEAQHRWLRPAEICEILTNYHKFQLRPSPPVMPPGIHLCHFNIYTYTYRLLIL